MKKLYPQSNTWSNCRGHS